MSLPSIETLGGQAVEPFSRQPARSEVVEQFREIVEQMVGRLNAHRHLDTEAPARAAAPGLGVSAAVATQLMLSVPTPSRHGLSATGSSMLLDPDLPLLDSLSADSVAGDKEYNAREVVFRERLDLQALESRLSESARGGRDRIPRERPGRRPPKCRVRQRSSWVERALHGRYREIYARGRAPLPASLEQRHRFKRIEGVPDLPKCCWRYRLRLGPQAPLSRSYLRN